MNNFLLYFGFFLVIVFVALFGLPYAVDWNSYRGVFEEEASRVLGREIRVAGNVGLKLLPSPYFHFEKIQVGPGAGVKLTETSFKAEDFRMWISVPPLLKGVLEVNKVELSRPVIETHLSNDENLPVTSTKQLSAKIPSLFTNVTLQSVKLIDGSLGVIGSSGKELLRFDRVNGEFSADTLEGPFRFNGQLVFRDGPLQIRISTSELDQKGDLRFKALATSPNSGNTYTVEAIARDILKSPNIEGEFKSHISGASLLVSREDANIAASKDQALGFEITSLIKMSRDQLFLDDLTLNVEESSLPQLLKGRLAITWKDRPLLDVALSSKWVNLDPLLSHNTHDTPKPPLELAPTLARSFVDALPRDLDLKFDIRIDQIEFNKQRASALTIVLEKAGSSVKIKEANAEFPGASKLSLKGEISAGNNNRRTFFGDISLEGQSLSQFLDSILGTPDGSLIKSSKESPYVFSADLKVGSDFIEFSKLKASNKNAPITGNINLTWKERFHISADLFAEKLDLADFGAGTAVDILSSEIKQGDTLNTSSGSEEKASSLERLKNLKWFQNLDWDLELKAKSLLSSGIEVEDVEIAVFSRNSIFSLSKLKLRSSDILALDLRSSISEVNPSSQRHLRGTLQVTSPAAGIKVVTFLGFSKGIEYKIMDFARLAPLKLECEFDFGESSHPILDLKFNGSVNGGQANILAHLEDPWGEWGSSQTEWKVNIRSTNLMQLFKTEDLTESLSGSASSSDTKGGTLELKATGKPFDGLETYVQVKTEKDDVKFVGKTTVAKTYEILASGTFTVDSQNLSSVLLFAGFNDFRNLDKIPLKGSFLLNKNDDKVILRAESLNLGTSSVSGTVTLSPDLRLRPLGLDAKLTVDHFSVPNFLSILSPTVSLISTNTQQISAEELKKAGENLSQALAYQNTVDKTSLWSDAPFDLSLLKVLNGVIELNIGSLDFDTGGSIKKAHAQILLAQDKIDIKKLEGEALGGKVVSDLLIERQIAGVRGRGHVSLTLSQQNSQTAKLPKEKTSVNAILQAKFEGKALTPRNLIDSFEGAGSLNIDRYNILAGSPKAISDASKAYLQDKSSTSPKALADVIKSELQRNKLEIKKVTVPVEYHQGKFKIERIETTTEYGRTSIETDFNLQTLDIRSSLKIDATLPVGGKGSKKLSKEESKGGNLAPGSLVEKKEFVPSVSVVYSGPLRDLESLNPTIALEDLQRELLVRRLELDVKELEMLRKRDESISRDISPPVIKETLSNENVSPRLSDTTIKEPVPVINDKNLEEKNNSDVTSSTNKNDTGVKPENKSENINSDGIKTDEVPSNVNPPTTEVSPSHGIEGENSSDQKGTKKKQSDSLWPSLNLWPF